MTLKQMQIVNAAPGMHVDGNGLYLSVTKKGAKSWIYRFQLKGKRREMGLGPLNALPPTEARARAAQLKVMVANGVDPIEKRAAEIDAALADERASAIELERQKRTFRSVAELHIANHEASWRNEKHAKQWTSTLETYVFPWIGSLPVDKVAASHVVEILQPIWATKPETASRVRMRIEAILSSAKARGWRCGENPAIWKGGLDAVLPRSTKIRQVRHHASMPWIQAPAFMAALRMREGASARALEFTILTAARSGEVRGARWNEIDFAKALWTIPAERMKSNREHRVPLCACAIEKLRALPRIVGCDLLFPGMHNQPLSDMSLAAVLKRMGFGQFTVHGFRSTFRDWAAENGYAFEVAEAALAHKIGLKEVAAYLRTDHLDRRRVLMSDWADKLGTSS